MKKPKCRCYINAKHYARKVSKYGDFTGYKPCPIHEKEDFGENTLTLLNSATRIAAKLDAWPWLKKSIDGGKFPRNP